MTLTKCCRRLEKLRPLAVLVALSTMSIPRVGLAQPPNGAELAELEPVIDLIETYGLRNVSRSSVIEASGLKVGDVLRETSFAKSMERIAAIPGVRKADAAAVGGPLLKDGQPGMVLYLGIEEEGSQQLQFRKAPSGDVTLPIEIVEANTREQRAFQKAAANGQFGEDASQGHSLASDPELRAAQERYIPLSTQYWDVLVDVLHNSRDSTQRAIAAKVIAYAKNKERVVQHLVPTLHDPDPAVRNNAARALSLIFKHARAHPDDSIVPPADLIQRLIEMLDSLEWTDRNKAIALLLSIDDDDSVLRELREQAVPTLVAMSRWRSAHGEMAFMLLGRLVGVTHDEAREVWKRDGQADVIARVEEISATK